MPSMRLLAFLAATFALTAAYAPAYAAAPAGKPGDAALEKAFRENPDDPDVTGEVGLLRMRQDRLAEAYELLSRAVKLSQGKNDKWVSMAKTAHFWLLLREARNARSERNFALAETKAKEAIKLEPKVADGYVVLAVIQADRGQAGDATASYRRALSLNPVNAEALEGLIALYRRQGLTQAKRFVSQLTPAQRKVASQTIASLEYSSVEAQASDPDEFLPALALIPAEKRPANISRLWGDNLEKRVDADVKAGHRDEAVQLLREAEPMAVNDEVASLAVALSWGRLGEYRHADQIFDQLKAERTPPSTLWRLRHARYLAMKHSPDLAAELDVIAALPALSPDEKQELLVLQESLAKLQLEDGNPALAHQTLAPLLKNNPDRPSLLLIEARAYQAEKKWALAQSTYENILQLTPGDGEATKGLIETKLATGDRAGALALLNEWAERDVSDHPYNGLKMVSLYLELGEDRRAHQVLSKLLEQYPNQGDVLFTAAQMAHRDGRLNDEIKYLQRSIAADRAERAQAAQTSGQAPGQPVPYQQVGFNDLDSPDKIHRDWKENRLSALLDQRTDWFSTAVDVHGRSGSSGMSQLHSLEIPLEYRAPWHQDDEVTVRTDYVNLNAGNVGSANTLFGSMQLCQPNCASAPLSQSAQGMSFDAGYHRGSISADLGVTPTNFLVSNVVGGIRQQGDFESFGYSLEASRRAVTDSLLSFAGSRDPNTGKVWGGVVATGARFGISIDKGKTFGFWSSLGWHNLTGTNVQSNQRTQIMAGEQWRMINEDNRKFIVGVTAMYWRFARDAGEYTFGQGGYYSPHNYRSLSLPVTYMERHARISYMLRGSVSIARADMSNALYYPTDNSLQQLAGNPMYFGSSTTVRGYSLMAACEYQASRKLFAGALAAIDRSQNYAPNRAMVYLRYALDQPASQPVFLPPLPVEPSSQFR